MDETLSWGPHISEVSGKVAEVLAVLRRLKPLCPGGFSLPQFTNHWVCLILIIVVLSGEILNRAAPTITGTGWDVRSPQILCDYLHDEPRRQENKPIKNINVQNSEQVSTRIHIRKIFLHQFHPFTDIICGAGNTISSFQDHTVRYLRRVSGIGVLSYGIVCRSRLSRPLV